MPEIIEVDRLLRYAEIQSSFIGIGMDAFHSILHDYLRAEKLYGLGSPTIYETINKKLVSNGVIKH